VSDGGRVGELVLSATSRVKRESVWRHREVVYHVGLDDELTSADGDIVLEFDMVHVPVALRWTWSSETLMPLNGNIRLVCLIASKL
jgi:hypothetical protein